MKVPYEFRQRRAGTSKLDSLVAWEYLMRLADKRVGRFVPVRFLAFSVIGAAWNYAVTAVYTSAAGRKR